MVEIFSVRFSVAGDHIKRASVICQAEDWTHTEYVVRMFRKIDKIYFIKIYKNTRNHECMLNDFDLKFDDVLNISYDELTLKNMTGELNCTIVDLDIYYNMYLYLINKITEQELKDRVAKLF